MVRGVIEAFIYLLIAVLRLGVFVFSLLIRALVGLFKISMLLVVMIVAAFTGSSAAGRSARPAMQRGQVVGPGGSRGRTTVREPLPLSGQPSVTVSSSTPQAGIVAPPGWYRDPAGLASFRWWDGMRWTDVVHAPIVLR